MKQMKMMRTGISRFILGASISVSAAAVIAILVNWLSLILSGKLLNSLEYYIVLLTLSGLSIAFGLLVVIKGFLDLYRSRRKRSLELLRMDSEPENEYLAKENLASIIAEITNLPPGQRFELVKRLDSEVDREEIGASSERGSPVKVTMEVQGTPITVESPGVENIEEIIEQMAQALRKVQSGIAYKSREAKLEAGKGRFSTTAGPKIQPGIVRESEETYPGDEPAAQP